MKNRIWEINEDKPRFVWGIFGRSVVVFVVDAVLLFLVSWGVFLFVRHIVLSERIDSSLFTGEDWVEIIGHVAWPVTTAVIVFLFRNPLLLLMHEIQGLASRSYYRQGGWEEFPPPDSDSESVGGHDGEDDSMNPSAVSEHEIEERILGHLRRQYGTTLARERCIRDSMYYFDAIAKVNDMILGIEIKMVKYPERWKFVLERVQSIFDGFDRELQRRFVFVACVVGNDLDKNRETLFKLGRTQHFNVVFRFFEIEGNTIKEIL